MIRDSGINPEIISGILNFRDWDFRDSGLLKLPGLRVSGFRITELQDLPGFLIFWDPEPLPTVYYLLLGSYFMYQSYNFYSPQFFLDCMVCINWVGWVVFNFEIIIINIFKLDLFNKRGG